MLARSKLTEQSQHALKTRTDIQINYEKEDRRQCCQCKDHTSRHKYFAACWPHNFRNFRADLLNKLKRVGHSHDGISLLGSGGRYALRCMISSPFRFTMHLRLHSIESPPMDPKEKTDYGPLPNSARPDLGNNRNTHPRKLQQLAL